MILANKRGSGDEKEAQEHFTISILYGAILSALAMIVIGYFNEPLFRLFGADDELLVLAKKYLKPIFFAIPCCVFSNILSAYLRNVWHMARGKRHSPSFLKILVPGKMTALKSA